MTRVDMTYQVKISGDSETGMFAIKGDIWQHAQWCMAEFPDGKVRMIRLNQSADTVFSWAGRTSYKRHTVKCFVTCDGAVQGRYYGHYCTSALQEVL